MKKSIPKPSYWQDFEDLCKKLWGAEWQIPSKIKKNGRSGDDQSGIDVSGKPKGYSNYWGIQSKGKDDYTDSKLTKKEIDTEIEKAKNFKPKLEVFIFATTANKNAGIEEYVRQKDIELQDDFFEVLLYSWEDIVDLMEDHPNVLQWYLDKTKSVTKYDFEIKLFSENGQDFLEPKFEKIINRKKLVDLPSIGDIEKRIKSIQSIKNINEKFSAMPINHFYSKVNHSWVELKIEMTNTGLSVIEDWKVNLTFSEGVSKISDFSTNDMFMTISDLSPMSRIAIIKPDEKSVYYRPHENRALIQKDCKTFKVPILIDPKAETISISWAILARDYCVNGNEKISVSPIYEEKIEFEEVYDKSEQTEDDFRITYLVKDK